VVGVGVGVGLGVGLGVGVRVRYRVRYRVRTRDRLRIRAVNTVSAEAFGSQPPAPSSYKLPGAGAARGGWTSATVPIRSWACTCTWVSGGARVRDGATRRVGLG
jgi:hypothetical protein